MQSTFQARVDAIFESMLLKGLVPESDSSLEVMKRRIDSELVKVAVQSEVEQFLREESRMKELRPKEVGLWELVERMNPRRLHYTVTRGSHGQDR